MIGSNSISCDYRVAEFADDRVLPFYVIIRKGNDVTTRWTRADADHELLRLIALQRQQVEVAAQVVHRDEVTLTAQIPNAELAPDPPEIIARHRHVV